MTEALSVVSDTRGKVRTSWPERMRTLRPAAGPAVVVEVRRQDFEGAGAGAGRTGSVVIGELLQR